MKDWWAWFQDSKYHDWLEEKSRWHHLKTLGSSGLVRTSVLMPAFGYMLLLNDNVHQYLTVKYDGWLLHYLPNVWRIWFLFYGSFFLALATVLYVVFCPREIKQYSSQFEMAETEAKPHLSLNQSTVVQDRTRWVYEHKPRWMMPYFDLNNMSFSDDVNQRADPTGYLAQFCMMHWCILDMWYRKLRFFMFFTYTIGFMLIAIPAVFTFLQVTSIPIKQMFD